MRRSRWTPPRTSKRSEGSSQRDNSAGPEIVDSPFSESAHHPINPLTTVRWNGIIFAAMLSFDQIRNTHRRLAEALAVSGEDIELDRLSLIISQQHCPDIAVEDYLGQIDRLAAR